QLPGVRDAVEVVLLPWCGGAAGAPLPGSSCRPRRYTMTAKKKRISPDPAPKKKTPTKGPAPSTLQRGSAPVAAKAAKAAPSQSSALDAAARVLRESGQPMSCPELIEQMATKGYWTSPKGKTPSSTLYAAIAREVKLKGTASRFIKTAPGRFALRPDANRS